MGRGPGYSGEWIERLHDGTRITHPIDGLDGGVLDVGCGLTPTGDVNLDRDVYSRETGFQEERSVYRTRLDIRASGDLLPFRDGSFSAVWSSDAIEHTRTPAIFLEECIRVARRLVVIMTPHYWGRGSEKTYHRSRFKRRDFETMLKASKYQIGWRYGTTLQYLSDRVKVPLFRPYKIYLHVFKDLEIQGGETVRHYSEKTRDVRPNIHDEEG